MMIVCRFVEDYRYITTDILCVMYNLWFTVLYTIIRVVLTGELMYSLHCYVRVHVGFSLNSGQLVSVRVRFVCCGFGC